MYIMNERSGMLVNSAFVAEFGLSKTSDSTLLYGKLLSDGDKVSVSTFEAFYTRPKEYIMYRRKPEKV